MKNLIHNTIETSLSFIRFPFLQKISKIELTIPFYHIVSDNRNELIANLYRYRTVNEFKRDLDFFQKHYNIITLADLLKNKKEQKKLPQNALLLTFDDGMKEMYEIVAPILLQKGIPATFFLTTDFLNNKTLFFRNKVSLLIEFCCQNTKNINFQEIKKLFEKYGISFFEIEQNLRSLKFEHTPLIDELANYIGLNFSEYLEKNKPYLEDNQVIELIDKGFSIGAHSINHQLYKEVSKTEQIRQTIESVNIIRNKYKLNYGVFAFPFSDMGVSANFFAEISKSGFIDVVFSADGFYSDECKFNYHRFWMENTTQSAKQIVLKNMKEKFIRQMKGTNCIARK